MEFLAAPWRWSFISQVKHMKGCFFCQAVKNTADKESLVCLRGNNFFIIMNKYPYNSGHIMVAPLRHLDSPQKLPAEQSVEMIELLNRSLASLKQLFNPDGFNVGMNIGNAAGAGVKDHFHLHIVPRWNGDANFMSIIGDTKIVSYSVEEIYAKLYKEFNP